MSILIRKSCARVLSLIRPPSPLQSQLLPPRATARLHMRNPARDRPFIRLSCQQIRCTNGADHDMKDAPSSSCLYLARGMQKVALVALKDYKEAEEIWDIRNLVLWVTEYCILSHNISCSMVLLCTSTGKKGLSCCSWKVMALVWAGSQVTKLARAGGALALAPFVDRGLSWFAEKYQFESREKAFFAAVMSCFGLAIVLFLAVTLISA